MNISHITDGFGTRFKHLLKDYKVSQVRFAKETGIHPGQVSRYINGERPSGDFILKAVAYFPSELHFLFFGDSPNMVSDNDAVYSKSPEVIVRELERKISQLKTVLSQK
ncbi:MAG: helix-turn-helix transcriptional regulator [Winogradskyella sp.]|uniref:helix-turn-helix domain-containing protein n=1 Tax=Winogradskyella sp. TaxID=1883156 RepID=UPI0025F6D58B|nr:helix-turn-helix transcriptional regulator [Winogradskyella sp.]NRB58306.1 helix-turn-helix transcriptional regulator [Winogradskyella sp.]